MRDTALLSVLTEKRVTAPPTHSHTAVSRDTAAETYSRERESSSRERESSRVIKQQSRRESRVERAE